MSQTTSTPPTDGTTGGSWCGDLRDLDASGVLAAVTAARRSADAQEAALLAAVVAWVDLHPVTEHTPAAAWPGDQPLGGQQVGRGAGEPVGGPPVAGAGTPQVAGYAVEELGAALGISYRAALGLVGDALELCYRLPRLWALVHAGRLQAWKARQVTTHTRQLSAAAVGFVDRHTAVTGTHNRLPANLAGLVHDALAQCDPETATGREDAALAARQFPFKHREPTETSTLTATLDTLDALDLDATVPQLATEMGRLGDTSPLGVRRSHALGMLAHPERTLTLFGNPRTPTLPSTPGDGPGPADPATVTSTPGDGAAPAD